MSAQKIHNTAMGYADPNLVAVSSTAIPTCGKCDNGVRITVRIAAVAQPGIEPRALNRYAVVR